MLTGKQQVDFPQLPDLLDRLSQSLGNGLADRSYNTNQVLVATAQHEAEAVILPKAGRLEPCAYDENLYADCNKVEHFFGRLKKARSFATRYEKTATFFLTPAYLLVALDWLR